MKKQLLVCIIYTLFYSIEYTIPKKQLCLNHAITEVGFIVALMIAQQQYNLSDNVMTFLLRACTLTQNLKVLKEWKTAKKLVTFISIKSIKLNGCSNCHR